MVSACVLTRNEEAQIEACLETLKWCGEVLVIDDDSTDRTQEIARKKGAKVYRRTLRNDFAGQRNFGLEKASGEWVFFIDADERVSPTLQAEIQSMVNGQWSMVNGFYLKREDKIWGRVLQHGETANVRLLRLAKKGAGKWTGPVHEVWQIKGQTEILQSPLLHLPHRTLTAFLEKVNFYSTIRAKQLYDENYRTNLLEIMIYPKTKFLKNYFLLLGFLDGMPGLVVALLMSLHSFLVRSKLYLLWKKKAN